MARKPPRREFALALLGMIGSAAASAQGHAASAPAGGVATATLTAELVRTGLYLISGGGGNSLLRFSANGLALVNGKRAGTYRALMSQVRRISKISDLPVRALIITDHHEDHAGNAAEFVAAGIPIIAHENIRQHLSIDGAPAAAWTAALITYERDYRLRMGGVETRLMHFGNAHTDCDTVVYFPNLKVVAVGDLFTPDAPEPDYLAGGSLVNWGPVLGKVLELDFDIVAPATGPTVRRSDLEAFKARIDTLVSRATALARAGVQRDGLLGRLKTDDLGWRFNLAGDSLDRFYSELLGAR